jgi:hypothetical protein
MARTKTAGGGGPGAEDQRPLPEIASITGNGEGPILEFAAAELSEFMENACGPTIVGHPQEGSPHWRFSLEVDASMEPYSFSVESKRDEEGHLVRMLGADQTCVLHAVYTALERLGYRFEITGPVLTQGHGMEGLVDWSTSIHPAVLKRGPNPYMNFPMDISSYPLSEAREYIRNLARMRFNHIAIHSYLGQFICVPQPDGEDRLAGNFFYGQRHDIPDVPFIRQSIRNERTYCIPEIEPVFDDPAERSRQAVRWMQALMEQAKRAGFTIEFIFETGDQSTDVETTVRTAEAILASYPQVDTLDLQTCESGAWGDEIPVDELRQTLLVHFGSEALEIDAVAELIKEPRDEGLLGELGQLGHNIRAIKELRKRTPDDSPIQFTCGIYCVAPEYLGALVALMRRFGPADVNFGILPGHGSRRVVRFMEQTNMTSEDWQRTNLWSWIEFDGNVYLQQNSVLGIRQIIEDARKGVGGGAIPCICLIHWRVAENRTVFRYAALATLFGPVDEAVFYREYAQDLGLGEVDDFVTAMSELDEADHRTTEELPNVGFSYVGCWYAGGPLGYLGMYEAEKLRSVRAMYERAQGLLGRCAAGTRRVAGRGYLSFLDNRIRCTIVYLRAIEKAIEVQPICRDKKPEQLSEVERKQVVEICDQALLMMNQYMMLHSEAIVDRGCEGTLISVYYTPPALIKKIRHEYGGVDTGESPAPLATLDPPPSPISF